MESDIALECFRLSEQTHGIRYMRIISDGDSLVMATLQQSVFNGPFTQKIECANHACKGCRSRLEMLAADHLEFRGRGGLTKRAMQRLTVGARVAIRMHSETGNIQQLRHDLRNGPTHVFGDHCECNPAFCKLGLISGSSSDGSSSSSDSDSDNGEDRQDDQTLTAQFEDIIQAELDNEPTATEEHDIHIRPTYNIAQST